MGKLYLETLLIDEKYLKAYSPLPLNYNWEDIRPFVSIAESVWIVPVIGRELYNELLEQIEDNEVTDVNSTLLLKIYKPLAMAVIFESSPFIWANLSEKGITLGKSDNSDSIKLDDLNALQNHLKAELTVLISGLKDFLNRNKDCYPLYQVDTDCCSKDISSIRLYSNSPRKEPRNF